MPNLKANIHQWTWYRSDTGKYYLCVSAGWAQDAETNEWRPQGIELLEYLTCTPKPITYDKMITALETAQLVLVKSPF